MAKYKVHTHTNRIDGGNEALRACINFSSGIQRRSLHRNANTCEDTALASNTNIVQRVPCTVTQIVQAYGFTIAKSR